MSIVENIAAVEARITAACERAGRLREDVRLMPVSKTKPPEAVVDAYAAGFRRFGENKVQEAYQKWETLSESHPDIEWAIIGHLQTNKAKYVARFATELQSLDSLEQARELDKRLSANGRQLDVLIQINSSAEPQKYGIDSATAIDFSRELAAFDTLRVKGLMTLALFTEDHRVVKDCFGRMLQVQRELQDRDGGGWEELSMGMSGDYELAIEQGATCVRVGQAIFGNRLNPDFYWPGISQGSSNAAHKS
ncbi:MAG: YggS family pyridoxal phosphate-dependent enzyme [Propionibacteriaceae bacterium]